MKNMLKRLVALAAALTMVLSVTAITCSAAFIPNEDIGLIMPLWDDDDSHSNRD